MKLRSLLPEIKLVIPDLNKVYLDFISKSRKYQYLEAMDAVNLLNTNNKSPENITNELKKADNFRDDEIEMMINFIRHIIPRIKIHFIINDSISIIENEELPKYKYFTTFPVDNGEGIYIVYHNFNI